MQRAELASMLQCRRRTDERLDGLIDGANPRRRRNPIPMRLRGATLPILVLSLALPLPALATTYYVRPGGSDSACTGTTDADHTSGSSCAWSTINKCDTTVHAGDTCQVAAGNYGHTLDTANSGTSSSRIVYVCPSRNCVVSPSSGDSLDLRNRSWITV